jgi:DNA-binding MarR family transcriptional regulator
MHKRRKKPTHDGMPQDRPRPPRAHGHLDLGFLAGLIGYMLRRAQLAVYQDFFRTFAPIGIRPAQLAVLAILERNPGLKQTEIAAALGIKRTNFVGLVNSLEERGLIERRAGNHDRRSSAIHLTEAGKVLVRRLRRMVERHERRITAGFDDGERRQLLAMLQRLANTSTT